MDLAQLVQLQQCYSELPILTFQIKYASCTIKEAASSIQQLEFLQDHCKIGTYIEKRLGSNDCINIINCTKMAVSPAIFAVLQLCQPTSASVERAFSKLNKMLSNGRNFASRNVQAYFSLFHNFPC